MNRLLIPNALLSEDHVGIATIVEVDTNDDTMDALRDDPTVLEKHTQL